MWGGGRTIRDVRYGAAFLTLGEGVNSWCCCYSFRECRPLCVTVTRSVGIAVQPLSVLITPKELGQLLLLSGRAPVLFHAAEWDGEWCHRLTYRNSHSDSKNPVHRYLRYIHITVCTSPQFLQQNPKPNPGSLKAGEHLQVSEGLHLELRVDYAPKKFPNQTDILRSPKLIRYG